MMSQNRYMSSTLFRHDLKFLQTTNFPVTHAVISPQLIVFIQQISLVFTSDHKTLLRIWSLSLAGHIICSVPFYIIENSVMVSYFRCADMNQLSCSDITLCNSLCVHAYILKLKLSHYTRRRRLGERRYSSYSFSSSALDGGEWSASRPDRALAPGKRSPVPIVQEAGRAPEPVWTQRLEEKSPLPGIEPRSPGLPARSQTLY
jgi:hypothetical protein